MEEQKPFSFYLEKYNKLLHKLTNKYYSSVNKTLFTYEEVYNIALMGLYIGLKTYEEGKGRSLFTHICITIVNKIYENTAGRSTKNIENNKFYTKMKSIYEPVSKDTEEVLIVDGIPDDFTYETVDTEIDIQKVYKKIRHIMSEVLEFEEEAIILDLYYWDKPFKEIAQNFNSTERQLRRRVSMILKKLRKVDYIREIRKQILEEQLQEIDTAYTYKELFFKEFLLDELGGINEKLKA